MFGWAKAKDVAALRVELVRVRNLVHDLSTKFSTSSPAALRVELSDLQSTLEMLAASNRREFGKLWKRVPGSTEPNGAALPVEGDIAAMLALQSTPPPPPR